MMRWYSHFRERIYASRYPEIASLSNSQTRSWSVEFLKSQGILEITEMGISLKIPVLDIYTHELVQLEQQIFDQNY
jgi:hypothetical protein